LATKFVESSLQLAFSQKKIFVPSHFWAIKISATESEQMNF